MTTTVQDCPRCRSHRVTFDLYADVHVGRAYDWQDHFEVFGVCRHCLRPSILRLRLKTPARGLGDLHKNGALIALNCDLGGIFELQRFVNQADIAAQPAPPDLPDDIGTVFEEGARCLAIGCHNAAAAMFRLCLDLASKDLLPGADEPGSPDKQTRRNLAPRLRWLFEKQLLPGDLRGLSDAVKENGDAGAHEGSIGEHEADDLYDFAYALLNRLYSEPARLEAAALRRAQRRDSKVVTGGS